MRVRHVAQAAKGWPDSKADLRAQLEKLEGANAKLKAGAKEHCRTVKGLESRVGTAVSAAFNSLWQASANVRNAAGSSGSSAVASDMSQPIRTRTGQPESKRNRCSVRPTLVAAPAAVLAFAANPSPRSAPKTAQA
jgi:hypothetical protein